MVRITQNLISDRTLFNLQRGIKRYTDAQNVVSTGQRITKPVDDPIGFPVALNLRSSIQQGRSFQRNVESARGNLELTETTMNSLTETLQSIRSLSVQGGNSIDPNARISIAEQIAELYGHIYDLSNTDYKGQSIFGGSVTDGNAFSVKDNAIIYNGDDFERNMMISKNAQITNNLNGFDTFLHTPNQITGAVSIEDVSAPLYQQLSKANPNFTNLPAVTDGPQGALVDPSPNPNNSPTELPNQYASFEIYGNEIRVDISTDSLEDVVDRINVQVEDVTASINERNQLVITSKRTDGLDLSDGERQLGFEPDTPNGLNLLSALGMNRVVESSRPLTRGYPATDPITDGTISPAPARGGVSVKNSSFLFAGTNNGPYDNPAVPFGDNLAITNIDSEGNDAYLANGDPDFINELEAIRITIDDEVIDIDLRALTEGRDFDAVVGNDDDMPGSTVEDLLELINNHPALKGRATAYINADQSGISLSATSSTDVFKVDNVRKLFGRDITQSVAIDAVTSDVTVTDAGRISMDTKLDDLPGALVDPVDGSLGVRRDAPPPIGSEPNPNRGLIAISNDGDNVGIDLQDAETIGDVIRAINDSKVGVEARINESGTGINIVSLRAGEGELSIVDMFDGTLARDLGLFSPPAPVRVQSSAGLAETDILGASFGTMSNGSFDIEVRDGAGRTLDTYTIDATTTDTIESLVKKIDESDGKAGPGGGLISAYYSGGEINIVSNYDGHVIVIDPANDTTGTDAASRITNLLDIDAYTFTLETDTPATAYESKQNTASIMGISADGDVNEIEEQNIFNTVKSLENALRQDDTEGISQALTNIDKDLEAILNKRTTLGARINRLDATSANLQDGEDFMRQELSSIEDADLAASVSEMTLAQNAFNAALSASSNVIQQSLMDFLR